MDDLLGRPKLTIPPARRPQPAVVQRHEIDSENDSDCQRTAVRSPLGERGSGGGAHDQCARGSRHNRGRPPPGDGRRQGSVGAPGLRSWRATWGGRSSARAPRTAPRGDVPGRYGPHVGEPASPEASSGARPSPSPCRPVPDIFRINSDVTGRDGPRPRPAPTPPRQPPTDRAAAGRAARCRTLRPPPRALRPEPAGQYRRSPRRSPR
jgi:hypothetical protein